MLSALATNGTDAETWRFRIRRSQLIFEMLIPQVLRAKIPSKTGANKTYSAQDEARTGSEDCRMGAILPL
jgi:hypothetical protein